MLALKFYTHAQWVADREHKIQREPGACFYCPWYYDPENPRERVPGFLSEHYKRDWMLIRPPIMVICPNGSSWCVDQGSSNGTGWTVTGDVPDITVMPSIVVSGYHGWLRDGVFSDDLEGRGPMGVRPN